MVSRKHTWSNLSQAEHFIPVTTIIDSETVSNLNWLIQRMLRTSARNTESKKLFSLLNIRKHFPLMLLASILGKQSLETEGN